MIIELTFQKVHVAKASSVASVCSKFESDLTCENLLWGGFGW